MSLPYGYTKQVATDADAAAVLLLLFLLLLLLLLGATQTQAILQHASCCTIGRLIADGDFLVHFLFLPLCAGAGALF